MTKATEPIDPDQIPPVWDQSKPITIETDDGEVIVGHEPGE